jgi:tight adherence protein C
MLGDIARTYLTLRIGPAHFNPLKTCLLILALATALVSAFSLWRIGQREDRDKRIASLHRPSLDRTGERAPSLSWYERLGNVVATTPIVSSRKQRKLLGVLAASGMKGYIGLSTLIAGKVCLGIVSLGIFWMILKSHHWLAAPTILEASLLAGAVAVGWELPELGLSRLAAHRRRRLELGLPDALDLLVICAEAGLSLDQAMEEVGRELRPSNRDVAEEFATTADEMRIMADREHALANLAQRAGLLSLRSIITTLNQSLKFGTPLAASLRVLAGEMRAERLTRIEERAARLPVLLTIPLMTFILPSLIVVIGTPLVLRIVDMLADALSKGSLLHVGI